MMSDSEEKACKIFLRKGQSKKDLDAHRDHNVTIYAPSWVTEGLTALAQHLNGIQFHVFEPPPPLAGHWANRKPNYDVSNGTPPIKKITMGSDLSLVELQTISRNESWNTWSVIQSSLYECGGLTDMKVLLALKDLARQSVIVGRSLATHYGGFPERRTRSQLRPNIPVYVCHLVALQFSKNNNSGRLVTIQQESKGKPNSAVGLLDELIFEKVVGEKKKTYEQALPDAGRYKRTKGYFAKSPPCLFDSYAYKRFVAVDVILTGLGVADTVTKYGDKDGINLKFLKYGTGKYAGNFAAETNNAIMEGVLLGMETLFNKHSDKVGHIIKHLEFPFYAPEKRWTDQLDKLQSSFGVSYSFSTNDALEPTVPGMMTATTNCGASMSVFGNAMGMGSVDGIIATNLKDNGATFCPLLNPEITEKYLDINL